MGLNKPNLGEEKYKTGRMWGRLKSDLSLTLPRDTTSSAQIPLFGMSFFGGVKSGVQKYSVSIMYHLKWGRALTRAAHWA